MKKSFQAHEHTFFAGFADVPVERRANRPENNSHSLRIQLYVNLHGWREV